MKSVSDSSQAGYLAPAPSAAAYDVALEDLFQATLSGITGIPGSNVRPRYQRDPPPRPAVDVDWVAFGVALEDEDWNAYRFMDGSGNYFVERTEFITLSASFYGPNCMANERLWRDGLAIDQNLDDLVAAGVNFREVAKPAVLPALFKDLWQKKVDTKATFTRWSSRQYPVLSFTSATVTVLTDSGVAVTVNVNP